MINFSQYGMQTEGALFEKNERQVNQIICKVMAYAFCIFPIMLLINAFGLFKFSGGLTILLVIIGVVCCLSPIIVCKFVKNQKFIRYYVLISIILIVCVLGTEYYVGIYITFILAPLVSCMYFDKKFTSKILLIDYLGFLVSYYFRSMQIRDHLYPTESVWPTYLPLILGFTIEFFVCYLFLYNLANRTHYFLVEQKQLINEMSKNEAKIQLAMDATRDILFDYSVKDDTYSANGTIRGWERKNVSIDHFTEYVSNMQWETPDFVNALCKFKTVPEEDGNRFTQEICITFQEEGKEYISWAYFELSIIRNSTGQPETVIGKLRDITQQKLEEIKAEEAKNYDTLTGMYNYSSLRKIVKESEGKNRAKTHQVMIVHIRNYKKLAECYGEIYRDFIIMNTAEVIKKAVEGEGVLNCRLSQDVFLVYVADCDKVDSRTVRQNLNKGLREVYVGEKEENKLEYDFGYYLGEEQIDELFTVALHYVNGNDQLLEEKFDAQIDLSRTDISVVGREQKFSELSLDKKTSIGENFIASISALILGAKDYRSAIQMSMEKIGGFFGLDSIRVYETPSNKQAVMPAFVWTLDPVVSKESAMLPLESDVRQFFVDNFGKSRITDNTTGAFQDFFREFGESPVLLSEYSSLICPIMTESDCRAIILYDVKEVGYSWDDQQKEFLLELSKLMGNYIITMMEDSTNKAKNAFLSEISREIRTPINVIMASAEIARNYVNDAEKLNECLDQIDQTSAKMAHIINDITDLSKMEKGNIPIKDEIFSMENMIATVEENMMTIAKEKSIELFLERKFQENLLRGDVERIQQVMTYLIENAMRYTKRGGRVWVLVEELSQSQDQASLFFKVQDNGVGMSKEEKEKLFLSFDQGDSETNRRKSGTGLELSVCYQLVQAMGGKLEVRSEEGEGTEFYFTLQLTISPKESRIEYLTEESASLELENLQNKKVLVVDDDIANGRVMKKILEFQGAQVQVATDGKECLEWYNESEPYEYDIILMEIDISGMNGSDLIRKIRFSDREDAQSILIMGVSSNAFDVDRKEALENGADGYLVKPVEIRQLLQEIHKAKKQKEETH